MVYVGSTDIQDLEKAIQIWRALMKKAVKRKRHTVMGHQRFNSEYTSPCYKKKKPANLQIVLSVWSFWLM